MRKLSIGRSRILECRAQTAAQLPQDLLAEAEGCDAIRVTLDASPDSVPQMQQCGFCFRERTIGLSIRTSGADEKKLARLQRLQIAPGADGGASARKIACRSFASDWRFCIKAGTEPENTSEAVCEYLKSLPAPFYAKVNERVCGFISLQPQGDGLYVALASADIEHPVPGTGMALYAFALKQALAGGYRCLTGRTASWNMPALNAYLALGAKISDPEDVFVIDLKERTRHGC